MFARRGLGLTWQARMLKSSQVLHRYRLPLRNAPIRFLPRSGLVEMNMSVDAESMMVVIDRLAPNVEVAESGVLTETIGLKTTANIEIANLV